MCVGSLRCVLEATGEAPGRECVCVRARAGVCVVNAEGRQRPPLGERVGRGTRLGLIPSVPRARRSERVQDAFRRSECYGVGRPSVTAGLLKEALTCVSIAGQTGGGCAGSVEGDPSGSDLELKA